MMLELLGQRSVLCMRIVSGVSTSAAFHCNWSVSSVLESASWRINSVFASFYFRNIQHEFNDIRSLGLLVAAGERIS